MKSVVERHYVLKRLRQERLLARDAVGAAVRNAHLAMAAIYASRLSGTASTRLMIVAEDE